MGHKNIRTNLQYAYVNPEGVQKAFEVFDRIECTSWLTKVRRQEASALSVSPSPPQAVCRNGS
jgi:hypothetical protein